MKVLLNFCSNALKFSRGKPVRVQQTLLRRRDLLTAQLVHGSHPFLLGGGGDGRGPGGGASPADCSVGVELLESALDAELGKEESCEDSQRQWLTLTVEDSGAGISAADLEKLFVMFSKLPDELQENKQGSGIGVGSPLLLRPLLSPLACAFLHPCILHSPFPATPSFAVSSWL